MITNEISLRPLESGEELLWRALFFDSVRDQFSALEMTEQQETALLDIQYRAQESEYARNYPSRSNYVVVFNDEPVGRVIYSYEHGDLHIIDMSILKRLRGKNIGTSVIGEFFDWSREKGVPIRFHVVKTNPALRLYERLGFQVVADLNTHLEMIWRG